MKHIASKIITIRNIIFTAIFCYLTFNHASVSKTTQPLRNSMIKYAHYNPFQLLADFIYWSVDYAVDFARFREQELEMTQLSLQVTALMNDFSQIKTQNEELTSALETLKSAEGQHAVKRVVKLHYSVINHGVKEVYFKSDEDIEIDGLVVNQACLIGRIFKKEGNIYHVLVTEDPRFRLPVYTKDSKVFGMLHGSFDSLRFAPFNDSSPENITSMEEVLTASFNERFTENVSVGNIMKKEDGRLLIKTECKEYYNYALVF